MSDGEVFIRLIPMIEASFIAVQGIVIIVVAFLQRGKR